MAKHTYKMKKILLTTLITLLCSCSSQEIKAPDITTPQAPTFTKEEVMKKIEEYATPGNEHQALSPLVGKWKIESKFWMEAGKEPIYDKGYANNYWVLDGRYIKEDYEGNWDGKPYKGYGFLGYDKVKKEYTSTWIDNFSTTIMTSKGSFCTKSNKLTMKTISSCPVSGHSLEGKNITRIIDNDNHILEMHNPGPDGKLMKTGELKYTRIK